jgi:hypothetical protein
VNEIAKQIFDLLQASGKSAAVIARALKSIGGGSMQDGVRRVADYFMTEGLKRGAIKGALGGVAITSLLFILGFLIYEKIQNDKNHDAEERPYLKISRKS